MTELEKLELEELLLKEARGALNADERNRLDEWYESFDEKEKHLVVFRDNAHEAAIRQRLLDRIVNADSAQPADTPKVRKLFPSWIAAAAVVLFALSAGLLWLKSRNVQQPMLSVETGRGALKKIELEDGTLIWLNAGSKLKYPAHFASTKREIFLEGEAYFEVKHSAEKPFIVHTDDLNTTVLGTAFSVTAYKNMGNESVAVISGKVGVGNKEKTLGFLTANKRIEYNPLKHTSFIANVNAQAVMSWKDGKLQFEDQNMQDIAGRLGRWYGYSFQFEHGNIKNCRYTASFDNTIKLNNLLRIMKAISLVNYRVDENKKTVTFLGTGCNE